MSVHIHSAIIKRDSQGKAISVRVGVTFYDSDVPVSCIVVFENYNVFQRIGIFPKDLEGELDYRLLARITEKAKRAAASRSGLVPKFLERVSENVLLIGGVDNDSGVLRAKATFFKISSGERKVGVRDQNFYGELGENRNDHFIPEELFSRMKRMAYANLFKRKGENSGS